MGVIADIRSMLTPKQAKPNKGTPSTPGVDADLNAASQAAVRAALQRVDAERVRAAGAIANAEHSRRRLLVNDATDEEIGEHDEGLRRHKITLERLALIEPELLAQLNNLQADAQRELWLRRRKEYFDQAQACLPILRQGAEAIVALARHRQETQAMGFRSEANGLPIVSPPLTTQTCDFIEAELKNAQGRASPLASIEADLYPVTFTGSYRIYHPGETASFPNDQAWEAVMSGRGVWADPNRVPPQPAVPVYDEAAPVPDAEGNVCVMFVRTGYQAPNGSGYRTGEQAQFPAATARLAVQKRFAIYVRTDDPSARLQGTPDRRDQVAPDPDADGKITVRFHAGGYQARDGGATLVGVERALYAMDAITAVRRGFATFTGQTATGAEAATGTDLDGGSSGVTDEVSS